MPNEKGLSDNPFRLTGLPSLATYSELNRKALETIRTAQIGRASDQPLSGLLGIVDLTSLTSIVRGLKSDTLAWVRSILFWPMKSEYLVYVLTSPPVIAWPIIESSKSVGRVMLVKSELGANPFESAYPDSLIERDDGTWTHAQFVVLWLLFLKQPSGEALEKALAYWHKATSTPILAELLAKHISTESGIELGHAERVVQDSFRSETQGLLNRSGAIALDLWQAGETIAASHVISAILRSPNDDTQEEIALRPILKIGDDLSTAIQRDDVKIVYDPVIAGVVFPSQAIQLQKLLEIVGRRHPKTRQWGESFDGFLRFHVEEISSENWNSFIGNRNYKEALQRCEALLRVACLPDDLRYEVAKQAADLREMLALHGRSSEPAKPKSMSPPPFDNRFEQKSSRSARPWAWALGVCLLAGGITSYGRLSGVDSPVETSTPTVKETGAVAEPMTPPPMEFEPIVEAPPPDPVRLRHGTALVKRRSPFGLGSLTVKNGSSNDAAVKITKLGSKKAIRYYYIQSGKEFTISKIGPGTYDVYFRTGTDWDKKAKRFKYNESLSKFEEPIVLEERKEVTDTQVITHYSRHSVTLHPVTGGTARTDTIDEDEFGEGD